MKPTIYIVISVFNRWYFTQPCLKSLSKQTLANFKIIVVDHGSTDGTSQMIVNEFPEVILLKGNDSMWWTAATNLGVQKALELSASANDLVLTLNNDLEVEPDYLTELLAIYEQNKPCLVGSASVDINNIDKIAFIGGTWNSVTAKYTQHAKVHKSYKRILNEVEKVSTDLLPGRGTLIPINLFSEIGLYDDIRFPHYAADEDFSLRAKKSGYKLFVAVKGAVKSHITDTGINFNHKKSTIKTLLQSLHSIRSANNLSTRIKWARKHSPVPLIYFTFDFSRILGSFLKSKLTNNA